MVIVLLFQKLPNVRAKLIITAINVSLDLFYKTINVNTLFQTVLKLSIKNVLNVQIFIT